MSPHDGQPDDGVGVDDGELNGAPSGRRYASISHALKERRIPLGNHNLIRRFVDAIGIAEIYGTTGYIRAVRLGGGPDLRIASGWSNGFVSEEEVVQVAGDVERWESDARTGLWGLSHPEHGGGGQGGSTSRALRQYGVCPVCHIERRANGSCECD